MNREIELENRIIQRNIAIIVLSGMLMLSVFIFSLQDLEKSCLKGVVNAIPEETHIPKESIKYCYKNF